MRLVKTSVAIGNDSQKAIVNGSGGKTRRLDPYQGNDATRGTPKRPGGFSRFGQASFQPYESPNLLHGCTFVSPELHTVTS